MRNLLLAGGFKSLVDHLKSLPIEGFFFDINGSIEGMIKGYRWQ